MQIDLLISKLARGSLAGAVRVALAVPLYLVLTPFVLHTLGAELFGLWSFGTLLISVMTLTDFGLKSAFIYHAARESEHVERANPYFTVVMFSYAVMALLVLAIALLAGPLIVASLLQLPDALHDAGMFVLWSSALGFALRFLGIPCQALLEARQDHGTVQILLTVWLIGHAAATFVALTLWPNIYALGVAGIFVNAGVFALFWWRLKQRCPHVRLDWRRVDRRIVKDMLRYGGGIQVATMMIAAREPLLKVLVARAYDLASLASFDIVYRLCTQLASLATAPLLGTFAASALLSKDRPDDLQRILRPMFGFVVALFVPVVLFFASFSEPFVLLWLGEGHDQVARMLPVAVLAFAVYYTTETLYKAIEASGMSAYSAVIQSLSLLTTIGTFGWLQGMAEWTVPIALLSGFVVFSAFNVAVFRLRYPTVRLWSIRQGLWLVVPALVYCAAAASIDQHWRPAAFSLYLVAHLWCARRGRIFDSVRVAQTLVGMVAAKSTSAGK